MSPGDPEAAPGRAAERFGFNAAPGAPRALSPWGPLIPGPAQPWPGSLVPDSPLSGIKLSIAGRVHGVSHGWGAGWSTVVLPRPPAGRKPGVYTA